MEIICRYDKQLETLFKEMVQYAINLQPNQLNLALIESVELVQPSYFQREISGHTTDNGRKVYLVDEGLSKFKRQRLSSLIARKEDVVLESINTIFHEMGHSTDWRAMPKLYACASGSFSDKALAAHFWLEYLAEKRSKLYGCCDNKEFLLSIAQNAWNISVNDYRIQNTSSFFYLNRVLPYLLAGMTKPNERSIYMPAFKNPLVKEYVLEIERNIKTLEFEMPFDNPEQLTLLIGTRKKYERKFRVGHLT